MDLTLIRYCGHFLIQAEGGAKKYKRDHRVSLAIFYCCYGLAIQTYLLRESVLPLQLPTITSRVITRRGAFIYCLIRASSQ